MNYSIEQELQSLNTPAPRVTPQDIEDNIQSEYYFTAEQAVSSLSTTSIYEKSLALLTFCVVVLKNGYTVVGESACASPENFNSKVGERIARDNALDKIQPLMGYALKQELAQK